MTAKPPPTGRSLAERYPLVAATWDEERNGALTARDVAAQTATVAHWRCPAGHTWAEPIATRTKLDQWKRGDIAACRFCTGCWAEVAFVCGHTAVVGAGRADPQRLCPDCWRVEKQRRDAEWEERKAHGRARAAELKPQCQADARAQAEVLWADRQFERLPAFLHRRARADLVSTLTLSLIGERAFGNPPHAKLATLLAEFERLADGAFNLSGRGAIELVGTRFWAPSLSASPASRAAQDPNLVAELREVAECALHLETDSAHHLHLELMIARAYDDPAAKASTSDLTDVLTYALKDFAYARGWRTWRELHVPLDDERATGRLDLVIVRPSAAVIVIEIDSANVDRSVAKLELARDRGAFPVWLRWRRGRIPAIPGVHVVDLTDVRAAA